MRNWKAVAIVAVVITVLSQLHALDTWISDTAYDVESHAWMIDHATSAWRFILYDGPKRLIILIGLLLVLYSVWPVRIASRILARREAIFLLICLALVPTVIGAIRQNSGVACPYSIQRYGGELSDHVAYSSISSFRNRAQIVGCWPSGHVSGGFALLGFAFLCRLRNTRIKFAIASVTAGASMGVYQILRGAHFASHIAITLCIAFLLISTISTVYPPRV